MNYDTYRRLLAVHDAATDVWEDGRGTFNANHFGPPIETALGLLSRLIEATTDVLDIHQPNDAGVCRVCAETDDSAYALTWPCPTVETITDQLPKE